MFLGLFLFFLGVFGCIVDVMFGVVLGSVIVWVYWESVSVGIVCFWWWYWVVMVV